MPKKENRATFLGILNLPNISSYLADKTFSDHSEISFCQILPALMTVTTNHLLCLQCVHTCDQVTTRTQMSKM